MKRWSIGLFTLILALSFCGCGENIKGNKDAETELETSSVDYTIEITEDSPEQLAQKTAQIYQGMISGEKDIKQGFEELMQTVPGETADTMKEKEKTFTDNVEMSRDYFKENGVSIDSYDFSKTYYDDNDPNRASIYRIQNMSDGKMYFFKQDFILMEDGWKVRGDNLVDDFMIRG